MVVFLPLLSGLVQFNSPHLIFWISTYVRGINLCLSELLAGASPIRLLADLEPAAKETEGPQLTVRVQSVTADGLLVQSKSIF